jgi:hypothetical protein
MKLGVEVRRGYTCCHIARRLIARGAKVEKLWHAVALGGHARRELPRAERHDTADEVSQAFWHACARGPRRAAEY